MPTANHKVGEMLPKRTPNSKTWMNFDGSYTTEIHSGIVHFEDQHGNLQNINTDLYDEADFDRIDEPVAAEGVERFKQAKLEAKAAKKQNVLNRSQHNFQALRVPFDAHIPRNFQRGYTIGKGQDKLTFKPVKSSPSMGELSQTDRSIIVYQDVWNDTDVELQVQPDGLKETIHLKTSKAPTSFSFEVKGKDIADDFTAGALKLMPAWLVDAAGTERDVEQVVVRGNDNKVYVELIADVTGLVYPIAIDPTVVIQPNTAALGKDADVLSTNPSYNSGTQRLFYTGGAYYGLIQFDMSGIPTGAYIQTADLALQASGFINGSGGNSTIHVKRIASSWTEAYVNYSSRPNVDAEPFSSTTIERSFGLKTLNVKEVAQASLTKGNYGFWLEAPNSNAVGFISSDDTSTTAVPKLSITYNVPPVSPVLITPNGGESWNAEHLLTWQASTDAEGDAIVYEGQLSLDNGITWKTIFSNVTVTSKAYDFTPEAETATALIRVRAFDGFSYSGWDQSNGVFTIEHNKAPDTPINLLPSGGQARDRALPIRLSWLHNDPDAGDPQSKYDLQWRKQGTATWTSVTSVTTNQFHDLSGLTKGNHEWRVRTYDQAGLPSPYSDISLFLAGDKPSKASITNYSEGATVAVANPTIQWSSADQAAFKLNVKDATGVVVWTDEKISANKAVTVNANLANQQAYTLELSIRNADGLWSDVTAIGVNVSYTPPAIPVVAIAGSNQQASIQLTIVNPIPSGTEPIVARHDLFRKASNESSWKRIANNVSVNGLFTDHTPASGKTYQYYVRAWGENGTYRDSAIVQQAITLYSIWLMDPHDPDSLHRFHYFEPGRSAERVVQGQLMEFEGREQPMAEFSSREQRKVNVILQLKKESTDLEALDDLIGRRTTLLYRDAKGRRIYGSVFVLTENETDYGYTVPLEIQQVGYEEGI